MILGYHVTKCKISCSTDQLHISSRQADALVLFSADRQGECSTHRPRRAAAAAAAAAGHHGTKMPSGWAYFRWHIAVNAQPLTLTLTACAMRRRAIYDFVIMRQHHVHEQRVLTARNTSCCFSGGSSGGCCHSVQHKLEVFMEPRDGAKHTVRQTYSTGQTVYEHHSRRYCCA